MLRWTPLEKGVLSDAQERLGLTDRDIAEQLYIDIATWRRWRKKQAVPTGRLKQVAGLLEIEVVRKPRVQAVISDDNQQDELRAEILGLLQETQDVILERVEQIDERLDDIARSS